MFTRRELTAELTRLAAAAAPPLETVEFGNQDFTSPVSEQYIWAFRGAKADFESGLLFWVKTLQAQGWAGREAYFEPYAAAGLCKPLTRTGFAGLVTEYTRSLRAPVPPFLFTLDGFKSGRQMYADWNDVGAVAELADDFVAFYWNTTA